MAIPRESKQWEQDKETSITTLDKNIGTWKGFIQSTGIHGLNKVTFRGTLNSKARSVLWAVLWMTSAVTLMFVVTVELRNYYSYPTMSNTYIRLEDKLSFPTITICNMSPYNKRSFSNDTKTQNLYLSTSSNYYLADPVNWSDPFYVDNGFKNPITISDILSHSKNLSSFVYYLLFDNVLLENHLTKVYTDMGMCLRFNSNGTIQTSMYGALYNLLFYADVKTYEDYFSNYHSSGIKIAIHDPLVEPIMANEGLVIPPATDAYIEVHKQEHKFLPPPYKAFGSKTCEDRQNYRSTNCLQNCWNDIIRRECNCTDFLSKGEETFCSRHDFQTCSNPLFWHLLKTYHTSTCDCPLECYYERYKYSYSAGKYPSDFLQEFLRNRYNFDQEYLGTQFVACRVYFRDLSTTITEQLPKYDHIGVIIANLGGQLGLFLGASILSMTEIVEFLFFMVYSKCRKVILYNKINDNPRITMFK